jgi:[ribosomal protein S5]-alanine N-acetyltransferase
MAVPDLVGRRVLLRQPVPEDIETRLALGADPEIARMYGTVPAPVITRQVAEQWYDRLAKGHDPYSWVIDHGGRYVGGTRLHGVRLHAPERRAAYAIGLTDPAVLGLGLGTEATRLVLGYAFDGLGLHRVDLRVVAYNTRAIACYRKCGFVEEGRERETLLVDGVWHDDVVMAVLEDEYRALAPTWGKE